MENSGRAICPLINQVKRLLMDKKTIDPKSDPLWSQLIQVKHSDVFHSPQWMNVIERTYGFKILAEVILNSSNLPVAGVQFCLIEDMRGKRLVTFPFSDYCDPLVENLDQWRALSDPIIEQNAPYNIRILHNDVILGDDRLKMVNKAKWHGIDLERDLGEIWEGLEGSARRAIKKAQRSGVVVHIADSKDELRKFFKLHLGIRKNKYRLVAQPYQFFENIWDEFLGKLDGALMLAEYKGDFIGGVLFLEWKDTLYYKFNASNPEILQVRPNDLVIWEGVKYGKLKGLKSFDFGISDWDQEGLVRYKRKYASIEKTVSFMRFIPNDWQQPDQASQISHLFPQLTDLFTEETVPDDVTEKAGEILYRYFC
jgi:CelD/BcsL family acetyltransferase involved in cellulose biosynthesis